MCSWLLIALLRKVNASFLPICIASKEHYKYKRLSKQEVEAKIEKIKRGRFKVYIGAAPGVGKTYTMLREGNDLLKKGDRCEDWLT